MKAIPIAVPTEIIVFNTPEAAPASSVLAREIITLIKGINANPLPIPSTNMKSGNCSPCNPILLSWYAAIIKNAKLMIVIIVPDTIVALARLSCELPRIPNYTSEQLKTFHQKSFCLTCPGNFETVLAIRNEGIVLPI